jgi:hypothetical protein
MDRVPCFDRGSRAFKSLQGLEFFFLSAPVAQPGQSATVRRSRPHVQIVPGAPFTFVRRCLGVMPIGRHLLCKQFGRGSIPRTSTNLWCFAEFAKRTAIGPVRCSTTVVQLAVNELVAGSNPAVGAMRSWWNR